MTDNFSLDEVLDELNSSNSWRYTLIAYRSGEFLVEIAKFKMPDTARLCEEALRREYRDRKEITFATEDIHQSHTFAEIIG